MRSITRLVRALVVAGIPAAAAPSVARAQDVDSAFIRVERLIVAGDRSSARVLIDSLVAALPPESPRVADALYWRARSASNAADAERDYLRVIVEHQFSGRAPDALLSLAQLEFARGDRRAARRRYDRLLLDFPRGSHVARASLWSGRLALEEGDHVAGCATLTAALPLLGPDDVELRNQFDYFVSQCARLPATPAVDSAASAPSAAPSAATQYSVQVAAFNSRAEATALASRLRARGFDVRVAEVGTRAAWRVRIGRYATRADAVAALGRIRDANVSGIVVEAEPR